MRLKEPKRSLLLWECLKPIPIIMKNKKYFVKVNSRWTEVFTDKKIAQALARTYHTTVRTKIEDWQVNTAIVITLIVLVVASIIFSL